MIPQHEQVWVENASLTSANTTHCLMALYLSCVLNVVHAASCTDFAIPVFASAFAFTLPTKIAACAFTSALVSLWIASLRWFAILAWIAFTRRFFLARCAIPGACSESRYHFFGANLVPSLYVAMVFRPRSMPTVLEPSGTRFSST
jgi:hypothetical protein